jgi:hypothetical protein
LYDVTKDAGTKIEPVVLVIFVLLKAFECFKEHNLEAFKYIVVRLLQFAKARDPIIEHFGKLTVVRLGQDRKA